MQYQKQQDGSLAELHQKNVDFGGGLERLVAATEDLQDIFKIDIFASLITLMEQSCGKSYGSEQESTRAMRIIADHSRAATMLMADGAMPSNKAACAARSFCKRRQRLACLGNSKRAVSALCAQCNVSNTSTKPNKTKFKET
jgi:alanyl-tRNA synthetase